MKVVGEDIKSPRTIETIPTRTGRGGPATEREECRPGVDDRMEGSEQDYPKKEGARSSIESRPRHFEPPVEPHVDLAALRAA